MVKVHLILVSALFALNVTKIQCFLFKKRRKNVPEIKMKLFGVFVILLALGISSNADDCGGKPRRPPCAARQRRGALRACGACLGKEPALASKGVRRSPATGPGRTRRPRGGALHSIPAPLPMPFP